MFKKNQTPITAADIMEMDDQEVRDLNEKLAKKLLKQIAVTTVASLAVTAVIVKWADSLENDNTAE